MTHELKQVVDLTASFANDDEDSLPRLHALSLKLRAHIAAHHKRTRRCGIGNAKRPSLTLHELHTYIQVVSSNDINESTSNSLATSLISQGFFTPVKPFTSAADPDFEIAPYATENILNTAVKWSEGTRNPCVVSRDLVNKLFEVYLSGAQHETLSASHHYHSLEIVVAELQAVSLEGLSENERRAFFINCYNALSMHSHIAFGDISSSRKRKKFFTVPHYLIGGYEYNLSDIENGILRGNRPGHDSWARPFSSKDPRLAYSVEHDPRVLFALNNGASSSPIVRCYDAASLEQELHYSVMRYLHHHITVDSMKNAVALPMMIKWYRKDIAKTQDDLLQWMAPFMTRERRANLEPLIGTPTMISYKPYEWKWSFAVESEQAGINSYQMEDPVLNSTLVVEIVQKEDIALGRSVNETSVSEEKLKREKAKKTVVQLLASEYDRTVRKFNLQILGLACIGVLLVFCELEYAWFNRQGNDLGDDAVTQILKALVTLFTILLILRVYQYYKYQKYIEVKKFGFREHFGLGVQWSSFLLEAIVCAVHAPPFANKIKIDGDIILTDRVSVFCLLRLYLVARVVRDHSELYQSRKELVSSKGGRMHEVHALSSFSMTIKYLFQAKPTRFLLLIYTSMATMLAYAIYVAERQEQPDIFNYGNALWFTVVTMTTVGYGDLSVRTWVARTSAFLAALIGVIMSSMIFAAINQKLQPTLYQKYALKWMQDNRFDKASRHLAATIVQLRYRYWKFLKNKDTMDESRRWREESIYKIKSSLARSRFRRMRSDQRIGTRYETFMDFTDVHILKRIQLVDSHLSARFHWLEGRLHAMMVDLLGISRSRSGSRNRSYSAMTVDTFDAHDSSTYELPVQTVNPSDISEHIPNNPHNSAKMRADIIRAKTKLPSMDSTHMLTVHREGSANAAAMRARARGYSKKDQRPLSAQSTTADSEPVVDILGKLLAGVDSLNAQVSRLETRLEDVQTSVHSRRTKRSQSSKTVNNENARLIGAVPKGEMVSSPDNKSASGGAKRASGTQSSPTTSSTSQAMLPHNTTPAGARRPSPARHRPSPLTAEPLTVQTEQPPTPRSGDVTPASSQPSSPKRNGAAGNTKGNGGTVHNAQSAGPPKLLPHQMASASNGPQPIPALVTKAGDTTATKPPR